MRSLNMRACLVSLLLLAPLAGCGGPSTEDLMMRAAMRSRGRDDAKEDEKPTNEAVAAESESVATANTEDNASQSAIVNPKLVGKKNSLSSVAKAAMGSKSGEGEAMTPTEVLTTLDDLSVKPIGDRKPAEEVDDDTRRAKAVDNLTKIAEALEKYHSDNGTYPSPALKTETGVSTLSWRVELLPYLGHVDLYNKFDPTRPWNYEPNKSLLQYIPDVYVSPERYDTKTNYLLPAFRTFMFGNGMTRKKHDVDKEDGSANTILLLEVNDELAVEWTKPGDYEPTDPRNVKMDLGKVRGDGTFAVWANGWTVLLANGLSHQQIFNALTYDSGDGQLAGQIHRDIPLVGASDAASTVASTDPSAAETGTVASTYVRPTAAVEVLTREPLPIAGDLAKAQSRLREIYLTKIVEAKKDREKADLAESMLDTSRDMTADPAGAFALQEAAIKLSGDAGELDPILKAVDQRVGRFEVDAYEENMSALLEFAESTTRRDPDEVDGDAFLERCVPVIFAAINDDDYVRASALARHCYRLLDQKPDDEMMKSLNRLRVLLSSAKREYDKAATSLSNFRDDPSLVNDAAAFGRFLCFIKGDWNTGLPLVAMGDPKSLRELAQRDLKGAATYLDEVAIGDAWWRMSEGIRNGVYRQSLQDRAANWYNRAFPVMPESLDRIHVKNRLDELEGLSPTSPLALINKLADDVGVDLSTSLSSVANVGQVRRNNDDDDD